MAKNTNNGYRLGAVGSEKRGNPRSQLKTPSGKFIKRDGNTGRFMAGKKDGSAFKGVREE